MQSLDIPRGIHHERYRRASLKADPQKARVFRNGRSQAVRIPAEFRFQTDEVYFAAILKPEPTFTASAARTFF